MSRILTDTTIEYHKKIVVVISADMFEVGSELVITNV
jgi:hypothetical protein